MSALRVSILIVLLSAIIIVPAFGQLSSPASWATTAPARYQVHSNLTYLIVDGKESKLDVFRRRDEPGPHPTLVYIHGGGWTSGARNDGLMYTLPWLEMGWIVVNVDYRLGPVSPAPAAVEDCLCALRWIVSHAGQYRIDPARIVVTGDSSGGHLALMTGMTPVSAGLDRPCLPVSTGDAGASPLPKVAAIVNWYGITDVADLLEGKNMQGYAIQWIGKAADRAELARRVSPLTYVRSGLPPIITVHGDSDPTVPYSHAVRLRDALTAAQVPNQLITIAGGKHGEFTPDERVRAYVTIREFLAKHGLPTAIEAGSQAQPR